MRIFDDPQTILFAANAEHLPLSLNEPVCLTVLYSREGPSSIGYEF